MGDFPEVPQLFVCLPEGSHQSYPIAAITKMGDFIRVKKSVLELEDLLKLRFRPFRHKATGAGAPRYKVRQEKPYENGNQKTETYWDWV